MGFSKPQELPPELLARLGELQGASDEAIVASVSLWPLNDRGHLVTCGVIDYNLAEAAADCNGYPLSWEDVAAAASEGRSLDFALTEHGRQVIADCAA